MLSAVAAEVHDEVLGAVDALLDLGQRRSGPNPAPGEGVAQQVELLGKRLGGKVSRAGDGELQGIEVEADAVQTVLVTERTGLVLRVALLVDKRLAEGVRAEVLGRKARVVQIVEVAREVELEAVVDACRLYAQLDVGGLVAVRAGRRFGNFERLREVPAPRGGGTHQVDGGRIGRIGGLRRHGADERLRKLRVEFIVAVLGIDHQTQRRGHARFDFEVGDEHPVELLVGEVVAQFGAGVEDQRVGEHVALAVVDVERIADIDLGVVGGDAPLGVEYRLVGLFGLDEDLLGRERQHGRGEYPLARRGRHACLIVRAGDSRQQKQGRKTRRQKVEFTPHTGYV